VDDESVTVDDESVTVDDESVTVDDESVTVDDGPDPVELTRFVEVELEIGLRTNTRIEILGGLADSSIVAAAPQQISDKLEELAEKESEEAEDEDD